MQNVVFTQLSIPEFRRVMREEIAGFFETNPTSTKSQAEEKLPGGRKIVTLDELVKLRPSLGSKQSIYRKTRMRLIPFSKVHKRLYFDLDEIDDFLMSGRIKTQQEREHEIQMRLEKRSKK